MIGPGHIVHNGQLAGFSIFPAAARTKFVPVYVVNKLRATSLDRLANGRKLVQEKY